MGKVERGREDIEEMGIFQFRGIFCLSKFNLKLYKVQQLYKHC